jgi:hypothetical protein
MKPSLLQVCINQDAIKDGLRVLPVNVMQCKKMLVLCGPTYPMRLWCVWELCTNFAFSSDEIATMRVQFVPVNPDRFSDAVSDLQRFELSNAHCYDPNEEKKVLAAIDAVGKERFTKRIRELASLCCSKEFMLERASAVVPLRHSRSHKPKPRGAISRLNQLLARKDEPANPFASPRSRKVGWG